MSTTGLVDTARNPYGRELTSWDANLAAQFRALEQQGFDAREIFLQTRTWRGADGRLRQERMQRGVSSLPGYGQPTAVSEAVSGFVGAPRRFSVMDPQAAEMQQARDLGEQASVASQLYGALTPFAAGATMAKAGQMGGISPLTVYHGSPHRFKKFDASKIGTGEGAQAYGHGLYFAENPKVAKDYQSRLAGKTDTYQYKYQGQIYEPGSEKNPITHALALIYHLGSKLAQNIAERGLKDAKAGDAFALDMGGADYYKKMLDIAKTAKKSDIQATQGAFYTVDLPDEKIARMLDWDKPLSEQAPDVLRALDASNLKFFDLPKRDFVKASESSTPAGEAYKALEQRYGFKGAQAAASFREAGIPGIKYLDQGSRGVKQGTQNFVVFPGEEQDIKMLKIE